MVRKQLLSTEPAADVDVGDAAETHEYLVVNSLEVDGQTYQRGDRINLPFDRAMPIVEAGVIVPAVPPEQEP